MGSMIYLMIIILFLVLILWTCNNTKNFENKFQRVLYIVLGLAINSIIVAIIFNISKSGINYSNIEYCKNNNYYLVKPNVTLNNSNINQNLKFINLGSIILIDDNLTLENLIIFLNLIKKSDIKIVYLSELIKE